MRVRLRLEEGWSTLALLWSMLLISGMAISQADLISGLNIVSAIGSVAILAGLLLAKSRFSSRSAHFFSFVYGLFFLFFLVGTTLPAGMPWRDRVIDIVVRQSAWLEKAFGGGTSRDGLIFVIQTSAVYWLLGYTASWYTFRKPRVWRAVVPMGVVLLSVVYYYTGPKPLTLYMAFFILLSFLFVARTNLVAQEKVWRGASIRYERTIWFTFLRAGFLAGLMGLVLAWAMPTMAASSAVSDALSGTRGPWRDFQDTWTRLFSALRTYGAATADPYQDTLVLGGPRTIGSQLIMDVDVPFRLPYVYWQAIAYDTYENGRWEVDETESILHFPDDGLLNTPETSARQLITQTVTTYLPNSSFIYGAPDLVGSSKQVFVESRSDQDGDMLISSIRSRFILQQGARYMVTSRVSTVDAQSLREAPTLYPDWVLSHYLQMPNTITPETIALAAEVSDPYDNPFDKTLAIRDYLRQNITYNDQIAAPPDGVDPVHYVLFNSQEGYCNYYASAMAMMLRSQGIPARVASGYAQGEYSEDFISYRVRASNAHTWVEAYFPNYGWIQFEPTASLPIVSRPETSGNAGDAFASNRPSLADRLREDMLPDGLGNLDEDVELPPETDAGVEESFMTRLLNRVSVWQLVFGVAVLFLALVAILAANEWNKRVELDVERSYNRMGVWARWLGIFFTSAQTPYERADLMAAAVPEGKQPIRTLTRQFVLHRFSREHPAPSGDEPLKLWQMLRPILLRQAISQRLQRLQKQQPGR